MRKTIFTAAGLCLLASLAATPTLAAIPAKCGPLFTEAAKWNDRSVRDTEAMRVLVDGELEYVKRRARAGSRITLGLLTDEFNRLAAPWMLSAVDKALSCAAPATRECRPLYAQVAADKLRAERRLNGTRNYLMSFPASYYETRATRANLVRFAERYTDALQALLDHQQSTLAAVRCAAPQ